MVWARRFDGASGRAMKISLKFPVLCAALLLALLCAPHTARAQLRGPSFDTQSSARGSGLARAFSALADDPSAVRINPAGIGQVPYYGVDVLYQSNEALSNRYNQYTVSFVDSKTSELAAGVSYSVVSDNAFGFIGNEFDEAPPFSYAVIALADTSIEGFDFGMSFQWLRTDKPVTTHAHQDFEITVGGIIPFDDLMGLRIGVVGRNLIGSDRVRLADGISYIRPLPREFELAGSLVPWEFLRFAGAFKFDYSSRDDKSLGFGIAGEVEPYDELRVRMGYRRDAPTEDYYLTGGAGFEGKEGALIYGYEYNLSLKTSQHTVQLLMRWF